MEEKKWERRLGNKIHKVDLMMQRNITSYVKMKGIDEVSVTNGWIIRYLYENREKDIFQKDIEKHFSIGRSSVTNTIQLMEKKGYIQRVSVEKDARLKKVVLTKRGEELHMTMRQVGRDLDKETLKGISDEELQTFLRVMQKLEENLSRQKEERQQGKEKKNQ